MQCWYNVRAERFRSPCVYSHFDDSIQANMEVGHAYIVCREIKPLLQPAIRATTGGLHVKNKQIHEDHAGVMRVFCDGRRQATGAARRKLSFRCGLTAKS